MPSATPPLGLLYLAAYLRSKQPVDIHLIDSRAEGWPAERLTREIIDFDADIVGFTATTSAALMMQEAVRLVRQALPKCLVVLGGPHVTAFGPRALEAIDAHAVVRGEGELLFEQIVSAHVNGDDFDGIPGLIWRTRSNEVAVNDGVAPVIENLDELPFPAYDLLNMDPYWRVARMSHVPPGRYAAMFSSRGCPYRCIYCHRIFGKTFRTHTAARVAEELEHYVRTMHVNEIEFVDDVFNFDATRVLEFSDLLLKRNVKTKIVFPNALRTDTLTEESIDALIAAGMYHSCFALETGSPRLQKYIRKNLNIDRFLKAVDYATRKGVFAHGYAMMGFPTESEAEIKETIATVCRSRLHTAVFFTVIPYPNTELYDMIQQLRPELLEKIQYEDSGYTGFAGNLSDVPDNRFFALQREAWRHFYLSPNRVYRIVRNYPSPKYLTRFLPVYVLRLGKGLYD